MHVTTVLSDEYRAVVGERVRFHTAYAPTFPPPFVVGSQPMRTRFPLVILATLALVRAAAAAGLILYNVTAGPPLPPSNGVPEFHGQSTVPVTAGGLYDSSHGGALCPDPSTADYLCGRYYASADLVGGRLLSLRTVAQLHVKNNTAKLAYAVFGDAKIEIFGMSMAAVSSPVGYAYFNIGLSGNTVTNATDAGITVQAFTTVSVNGLPINCAGNVCSVKLDAAHFDPSYNSLGLRTDVSITSTSGFAAPVAANAEANYADTVQLLSIELHDVNDQPIPGAEVYLADNNGDRILTFPNTVDTSTTTSTLVDGGSTTTTTLPPRGGCATEITYAAVDCRLGELADLTAQNGGSLAPKLAARLGAARDALTAASVPATAPRRAVKSLGKAGKSLKKFVALLGSKRAKKTIADPARTELQTRGKALQGDLTILKQSAAGA